MQPEKPLLSGGVTQQRIRELEALLTLHRIVIPPGVTEVPPVGHDCFAGERIVP